MSKVTERNINHLEDIAKGVAVVLLGAFAIYLFKGLFENDNSKIVSNRGSKYLSDDKEMERIHHKLSKQSEANEIVI